MVATVEADAKLTPRGYGVRVAVAAGNGARCALSVGDKTIHGFGCLFSFPWPSRARLWCGRVVTVSRRLELIGGNERSVRLWVCSIRRGDNNPFPFPFYPFPLSSFPSFPLLCFFVPVPIIQHMKLTRKQIQQGLEQTPVVDILGAAVNAKLTTKQKAFAMNLAKGDTGSEALRKAYGRKGKPKTIANDAYKLRNNPDIVQLQEAYSAALEAQRYQTPAALRALVIDSLVKVIIDPEANHGQVVAAAKVLGTVTEVAAFTERKEVTTITSSEAARARVMQQLKEMMKAEAQDVDSVEVEALSLEQELAAPRETPTTPNPEQESLAPIHTIPLKQSPQNSTPLPPSNSANGAEDADLETPPGDVLGTNGVGGSKK